MTINNTKERDLSTVTDVCFRMLQRYAAATMS